MKCQKCGKTVHQCGGYLQRVNEKGVPGVWECRPVCESDLPFEDRLLLALDGEDKIAALGGEK